MTAATVVLHPRRPELELLVPGTVLDEPMIQRLRHLGVTELWVHHDALADLDNLISPSLTEARRAVYRRIKDNFTALAGQTITTAQILEYRQAIMRLVFELVGNRKLAGLTDALFNSDDTLFSHSANVAYLATLVGLELEGYVIGERKKLAAEHARDMTTLGLGAMLHDLGKLAMPVELRGGHESTTPAAAWDDAQRQTYRGHPAAGFAMLADSAFPASAKQVVLNHHQRYNGSGWPDLTQLVPHGRRLEQAGKSIHIFCRVVAAANVLDNLMRDAAGERRPAVAALHDFAGRRFDGFFDPVVRQAMLRKLPPFQVGSQVRLSNGRDVAVIAPSVRQPCRPVVRLLEPSPHQPGQYPTIFLDRQPELRIVSNAGMDVSRWLFELPELRRMKAG